MALSGQPATGRVRVPGLDGLRAIAVAAVLLYHAGDLWGRPPLPGGFLGVDVFFVLSGFLITSILIESRAETGRIALATFWQRRAMRLLPALLVAIAVVLCSIVMFDASAVTRFRPDSLAGAAQVANWWFIADAQGYFEQFGRPSPFQHLWSLSIEWQFYIIWPLVLAAMLHVLPRTLTAAIVIAAAVTAPLITTALYVSGAEASRLYYGTDTHVGGLLAGAALAFVLPIRPVAITPRASAALNLAGVLGIAGIVALTLTIGIEGAFYGGFLAVSALTAIVIASVIAAPARWHRALTIAPMQWLGTRSYAIYIVHWPLFVYTRPETDVPFGGFALLAVRLAATFALAEVLHRLVERTFMRGVSMPALAARPRLRRAGAIGIATIAAASVGAITFAAIVADAPPAKPTIVRDAAFDAPSGPGLAFAPPPTAAPSPTLPLPSPTVRVAPAVSPTAQAPAPPPPDNNDTMSSVSSIRPVDPAPAPGDVTPVTGVRVTAIGDSVMLGATSALRAGITQINIYAEVGIQTSVGVKAIEQARANGSLGEVLLVHLGNNGMFRASELDAIMAAAGAETRVLIVNVNVPRDWEKPNNAMLDANVARYPNATLVDWHTASGGHRAYFVDDGVHVTGAGAAAYVALIADAIRG